MKRALVVAGMTLLAFLGVTAEASATQASDAIYNSSNSEANMGIQTNYGYNHGLPWAVITNIDSLYWSPDGYLLNRQSPGTDNDAIGYYIGPGYCAKMFVQNDGSQWFHSWNYVRSYGPGTHYLWGTPHDTLVGIENHRSVYGGAYGCGQVY